ncbi:methylornithine synthase PylB [Clostridium sp. JNZ X4-2]
MKNLILDNILEKSKLETGLSKKEIVYLLSLVKPEERSEIFKTARELRKKHFGNKVFLYGFVYFSTYCRNDCTFCFYRKSNDYCKRYRKTESEIVDIAKSLCDSGVNLIDLTMGEDPEYHCNQGKGYEKLSEIINSVKKKVKLPIMISPGVVPKSVLIDLKRAGADWYACYQETHNRKKYKKLRIDQSYDERWNIKIFARNIGLLVEEGLLVGYWNNINDIADSMSEMKRLNAHQVRTMSFVPQKGTPLFSEKITDDLLELNIIAVMRLLFPDRLIPASLDVEGIVGLKERLDAGANVVTSIIPPKGGLVGVSQSTLNIDDGNRTVKGVIPVLEKCGLVPAANKEYMDWVSKRKKELVYCYSAY